MSTTTETAVCGNCKGRLIVPAVRGSLVMVNCPECGGLADADTGPAKGINVNIVSQRLRQLFKEWCLKNEYVINRAVVELMKKAILENPDLGDAARANYHSNQWGRFDKENEDDETSNA